MRNFLYVIAPKDNRRLRVLTQDELTKLMDEVKRRDINAWRITVFAMLVGCRFSDAARLLWGQVDFERQNVTFVKTKTVARVVPIGSELLSFLKAFGPHSPKEHVFTNPKGNPYKEAPSSLKTSIDALNLNEGRAENDRFSFHNLRHMRQPTLPAFSRCVTSWTIWAGKHRLWPCATCTATKRRKELQ